MGFFQSTFPLNQSNPHDTTTSNPRRSGSGQGQNAGAEAAGLLVPEDLLATKIGALSGFSVVVLGRTASNMEIPWKFHEIPEKMVIS